MNTLVSQIQSQQQECDAEVWDPTVINLGTTLGVAGTNSADGNCYGALPAAVAANALPTVGTQRLPQSLAAPVGATATYKARSKSGRDSENNIIIHFNLDADNRPSDGASCWLYYARLKQWHENFY